MYTNRSLSWSTSETPLVCWSPTKSPTSAASSGSPRWGSTLTPRSQMSSSSYPSTWPTPNSTMALSTSESRTSWSRHLSLIDATSPWHRPWRRGWEDHLLVSDKLLQRCTLDCYNSYTSLLHCCTCALVQYCTCKLHCIVLWCGTSCIPIRMFQISAFIWISYYLICRSCWNW